VSTQLPAQVVVPVRHAHAPAVHVWFAPHALPHAPQFSASSIGLTHTPPHAIRGAVQRSTQALATHARSSPHALPHAPQSVLLAARSTHTPLHAVWPAPQGRPHVPFAQISNAAHA
jgi:hypothetical protein